jgi:hypothetical protein
MKKFVLVLLSVLLVCGILSGCSGGKEDTGKYEDAAAAEVKNIVYKAYGETPTVETSVLYLKDVNDDVDVIVVVQYLEESTGFDGSYAVHVKGKGIQYVTDVTTEQSYDYDYSERLEDLKTLFKIS